MCRFECLTASIAVMSGKELPKVADAEKESQYGYVFGVSGPGEDILNTYKCWDIILRRAYSTNKQPNFIGYDNIRTMQINNTFVTL